MTRNEVLALKPGRELDVLAGTEIMGLEYIPASSPSAGLIVQDHFFDPKTGDAHFGWSPSTNISDAWVVVEKMGDCLHLRQHGEQGEWEAWFCGYPNSKAHGETAPEAICKAALLAVMEG